MKKAKLTAGTAATFLIVGTTAFQAFAADPANALGMPDGTAVMGNQAYSLTYANDAKNQDQITNLIVNSNNQVYVKDFSGSWINNAGGASMNKADIPAVTYTDDAGKATKFDKGDVPAQDAALSVSSVSAITKTKVEVTFNKPVDAAGTSNFSIDGVTVTGATLSSDRTKVDLDITGADWDTSYTVKATGLKVSGAAQADLTGTFKTMSVNDAYALSVTADDSTVTADAAHTTTIRAKLIDKATGKPATGVDGMVIQFSTSAGNLANSRVTVQNGEADVTFISETETSSVVAKVDAQVNEAQGDYKPLMGKVFGTTNVLLNPSSIDPSTKAILTGAESDVADRVTLHFNKAVSVKDFVKLNPDGTYAVDVNGNAITYAAGDPNGYHVDIKQSVTGVTSKIRGFKPVSGDDNSIVIILQKSTTLTDNANVEVDLTDKTNVNSSQTFVLTDPRPAEPTSVSAQGLKGVNVVFSEPITTPDIKDLRIDAGSFDLTNIADPADGSLVFTGDFDQNKFTDDRNVLKVSFGTYKMDVLTDDGTAVLHYGAVANPAHARTDAEVTHFATYGADQAYLTSGNHAIQLAEIKDYAGLTDTKNISTTQTLNFAVQANDVVPAVASITAQSPEQFDVKFNCDLAQTPNMTLYAYNSATAKYDTFTNVAIDSTHGNLRNPEGLGNNILDIKKVSDSEYIVQLKDDWTQIYNTSVTNKNYYNGKYALHFDANALANPANGKMSGDAFDAAITGNVISTADVTSPVISNIALNAADITNNTFDVTMSEPVKLNVPDALTDDPYPTTSETQGVLQTTSAYLLGTDANGNTVTVDADVVPYTKMADSKNDTMFKVVAHKVNGKTIQQLVNSGTYGNNWTVVAKSISDDAGNTASTLTKAFTLTKSGATEDFYAIADSVKVDLDGTNPDKIYVTFTDPVSVTGNVENAANVSNYTLDGNLLPKGSIITLASDASDYDTSVITGTTNATKNTIVISLPDGTLSNADQHTLVVAKSLKSTAGTSYDSAKAVQFNLPSIAKNIQDGINANLTNANATIDATAKTIAFKLNAGVDPTTTTVTGLVSNVLTNANVKNVSKISIDNVSVAIDGVMTSDKLAQVKSALGNIDNSTTYSALKNSLSGKTVKLTIGGVDYTVNLQ